MSNPVCNCVPQPEYNVRSVVFSEKFVMSHSHNFYNNATFKLNYFSEAPILSVPIH